MNPMEEYVARVRQLLASISTVLTNEEQAEVLHLINHDECGEALRALAWIIVEEDKRIPASAITKIRELSQGLVADEDFPDDFNSHASD